MMSLTLSSRPRETCCYPTTHYLIFYFSAIFLDQHTQKTHPSKMFKSRMERKWMVLLFQNLQWVKIVWLNSDVSPQISLLSGQFTVSYIQLIKREPYLIFLLGITIQTLQSTIWRRILHLISRRNKDGHVRCGSDHRIILPIQRHRTIQ